MSNCINLLSIEDQPADFGLIVRHLEQNGLTARCHRVESIEELEAAVAQGGWDVVLSDYSVPKMDFQHTLGFFKAGHPHLPLILVSGSIGEERAVELLKLGVWNFVLKDNLTRLVPAIVHSLEDAANRRERKRAEAALRETLREKEALLKEVHHRVKNNLQVVSSLLNMEAHQNLEPEAKAVLKKTQGRIRSMALLHETLYRTNNFATIDLAVYLREVAMKLFRAQNANPSEVQLMLELAAAEVELEQALPCGLLINELLTNTLKHGFPDGRHGEVRLGLQKAADGRVHLQVSDSGIGLPADFDLKNMKTLGLQLVTDLTKQLQGTLEIGPGPGASFSIVFTPKATVGKAQ